MRRSLLALLVASVLASGAEVRSVKVKKPAIIPGGVKTPGVQIPFANLKAEAEIAVPGTPGALLLGDSLWIGNAAEKGLTVVDIKTNKVATPLAGVTKPCAGIASGFDSLWVGNCADQSLLRLDPKKGAVKATIHTGTSDLTDGAIAVTADSIWMLSDDKTSLTRIDPESNRIVAETRLPAGCRSIIAAESSLWIACPRENKVILVSDKTNLITDRVEVAGSPIALAFGEGAVWVLGDEEGKVSNIDPKTKKITETIDLKAPKALTDLAFGEGSLWVTGAGFPLTRIHPESSKVVQQFHGGNGSRVRTSAGALWLLKDSTLLRIDPKRVAATLAE
jgi:streptogramin lyase